MSTCNLRLIIHFRRATTLALTLLLSGPSVLLPQASSKAPPKRLLLLLPFESAGPATVQVLAGLDKGLSKAYPGRVSIVVEFTRSPTLRPPNFAKSFIDWLVFKHQGMAFDVLCPILMENHDLAEELRDRQWPGIPIVGLTTKSNYTRFAKTRLGSAMVIQDLSDEDTILSAMQLLPETKVIALVGGSSSAHRASNDRAKSFIRKSLKAVQLLDLTELSIDEIPLRVRELPEQSFVLLGPFSIDSKGATISTLVLTAMIKDHANAPMFAHSDIGMGKGLVGGLMNSAEKGAEFLGFQVARIFEGQDPDSMREAFLPPLVAVDWREIKKWKIPESRIPKGAEIQFRELGIWEEYPFGAPATVLAIVMLMGLSGVLLLERRRRRESDQAVVSGLDLNRAMLASMSGRIAVLDRLGMILQVSSNWMQSGSAEHIFASVGVGENYLEWLRSQNVLVGSRVFSEAVLDVLEGRHEVRVEEYGWLGGEDKYWYEIRIERLHRAEGGAVVTHLDVTERKAAANERRRNLESLQRLNRVASVGQFGASLAHELAQPLASILSNAQAAERFANRATPDYGEVREAITEIIADDRRAAKIIEGMRALYGRQPVSITEVDLNQIAEQVNGLIRNTAIRRQVILRLDLASGPIVVKGASVPIQQVLLNFLNNSMDAFGHAPKVGSTIVVKTRASNGVGELIVEDNGPGISAEGLNRLFDSFYTTKADGLGMGLAICKSILESLGGQISGENGPLGGAIFRMSLPLFGQDDSALPSN